MIIASFLSSLGSFTIGPSKLLHFPDSLFLILLSQVLHGLIDPIMMIPSFPELIECAQKSYPRVRKDHLNDISSGLFNMFLGLGQILGPVISTTITKHYGFKECGDLIALISIYFGFVYYTATKEDKKRESDTTNE